MPLTIDYFLNRASQTHGDEFDYSKVIINGWSNKVIIICKIHGEFQQTPANHLSNKRGCPKCGHAKGHAKFVKTNELFVSEAFSVHGNLYDYSKVDYINNHTKVVITCSVHKEFLQSPDKHLSGQGCPQCGNDEISSKQRDTVDDFIKKANIVHHNKYDYTKTVYGKNAHCIVEIICHEHGSFWQSPTGHLGGKGCSSCAHIISKPENKWLDSLMIPEKYRQFNLRINEKLVKADAYDPNTNTIYEFYGDFWHGNPDIYNPQDLNKVSKRTYGELYNKTLEKENMIKNSGYNLVVIWENDWNKNNV